MLASTMVMVGLWYQHACLNPVESWSNVHHPTKGLSGADGERDTVLHAGGSAVAEWLKNKLFDYVGEYWRDGISAEQAIAEAYLAADKQLLSAKQGFMGLGKLQAQAVFKVLVCHDHVMSAGPANSGQD